MTRAEHDAQRERVAAAMRLAAQRAERHGVYPRRDVVTAERNPVDARQIPGTRRLA